MMSHIPTVQLKGQPALRNEPLVVGAAVVALAIEEALVPATARLNVTHANEGLWLHRDELFLFCRRLQFLDVQSLPCMVLVSLSCSIDAFFWFNEIHISL